MAIGVLEGPLGQGIKKYSQSNYGDDKSLYVNYPDSYADAIKNAGFDLVTTANNHLFDAELEGAIRTIKVLRRKKIDFAGSYLNKDEKNNNIKIVEKGGLKIAFLTYNYGLNGLKTSNIINGDLSYISDFLPEPYGALYYKCLKIVENDFERAKSLNPDLIIVLPHWGTQFTHKPDNYQKIWEKNFIKFGADIILGDHTHHVQPVLLKNYNHKKVFTLYSPGNYANVYREMNGDASALTEVYIDRKTKKIIGGAIIPMWTQSLLKGNYRAIPIYDIFYNKKLQLEISTHDLERIQQVHRLITKYMLGNEMDIDMVQKRYYFDENGFIRRKNHDLKLDARMKNGTLYKLIKQAGDVCFIGDSVTAGSNNNGAPWYEPIEPLISGRIINKSWGGATTKMLINNYKTQISDVKADLFIIAIGTNDVRYRNPEICAMDEREYINNLNILKNIILKNNPNAKFVFIAPWYSTDGDTVSQLSYKDKIVLNEKYTNALKDWTLSCNDYFIDANKYIENVLDKNVQKEYLVDFIHPNMNEGILLYSKAVLYN